MPCLDHSRCHADLLHKALQEENECAQDQSKWPETLVEVGVDGRSHFVRQVLNALRESYDD